MPFSEKPFTNDCERGKHQCATVRCSLLQFVEVCCSVLQCVTVKIHLRTFARERMVGQKGRAGGGERIRVTHCITLQYTATHCNTLQHTFSEKFIHERLRGRGERVREGAHGGHACVHVYVCICAHRHLCEQTNRQTDRQKHRQIDRQIDRQTDRQTDR